MLQFDVLVTGLVVRDGPIGSDQVQAMPGQRSHVYTYGVLLNGAATLTVAYELGSAKTLLILVLIRTQN